METSAKGRARPSEIVARVLGVIAMVCFTAFVVVFRRTEADGSEVGDLVEAVFDGLFLLVLAGPIVLGALGAALIAFAFAAVRTKGRMRPWTWALAGPATSCGTGAVSAVSAGRNTNRTHTVDRYTAPGAATATVTTTTACFDGTDRLLSTSSIAASAVGYDARGNTTRLGGSTLRSTGPAGTPPSTTAAARRSATSVTRSTASCSGRSRARQRPPAATR